MAFPLAGSPSPLPWLADVFGRQFDQGMDSLTEEGATRQPLVSAMPDLTSGTNKALLDEALFTRGKGKATIEYVASHPSQVQPERRQLLQKLSEGRSRMPSITLATTSAKTFGKDFLVGARRGQTHLEGLDKQLAPLVYPWLDAPRHKRIFVVASSRNEADVKQLKAALRTSGYQVFFYKFCEPVLSRLCPSEDVGAFFATAGHVIAFQSAASRKSSYITVELASIYKHHEGGVLIVFTPEDIHKLIGTSSIGIYVAAYELEARDPKSTGTKPPQGATKRPPAKAS